MNKKLAVYVSSYDGSADLWDNFFLIFDQFWKNCSYNIYLINNEIEYRHNNVITINTGKEINWFDRTIKSLNNIEEEYILFLLEDYYLSKNINESDMNEIIDFMEKENVFFYQLSKRWDLRKEKDTRIQLNSKNNFSITLQPAIWKKEVLQHVLKEINGKSPWDFENYYKNKYSEHKDEIIPGAYYDSRDILGYKNGVLRGKWFRETLRFYKKIGININTGNRKKLSYFKEFKYTFAIWCSRHLSANLKEHIKIFLKKIKFDYLK